MTVVLSQLSPALPLFAQRGASFHWPAREEYFLSADGIYYRQVLPFTEN